RERTLDRLLPLLPGRDAIGPGVAIVDIDRETLARLGPWPWPRARLARVVRAAAAGRPVALGLDILLAGPDRFSAAAILREDGVSAPGVTAGPPDGDALIAGALAAAPSVLGFALDNMGPGQDLPVTPILLRAPVTLPGLWRAGGVLGPTPTVAAVAQGFGAQVAAADADGPIRRVPLLVLTGRTLRPGLAVEIVRVASGAGALLI